MGATDRAVPLQALSGTNGRDPRYPSERQEA